MPILAPDGVAMRTVVPWQLFWPAHCGGYNKPLVKICVMHCLARKLARQRLAYNVGCLPSSSVEFAGIVVAR